MKCPRCKGCGRAIVLVKQKDGFYATEQTVCPECNGKGIVEQTNEEWLRRASTEDVAKWLSKISKLFHECGKRDVYPKTMYEEDWEWWLKEIHNG